MTNATLKTIPLLLVLALGGCDYVDDPIAVPGDGGPAPEGVTRKVLIEDFTGHRCTNCPEAARTAESLADLYGEELVVVGVHVTSTFAAPVSPPAPDGRYSTDFRTPAGNTYETTFNIPFLPTGAVSRKVFNNSLLLGESAWGSAVADIIGQPASLDIWFSQLQHNTGTNTVSAEVKVAVVEPITENLNLTIYLTEDHVIDWQLDGDATPPDVADYEHRHVLRTNLNGTWGATLVQGSADVGDTITLSYPDLAMDPSWVAANCALVAYAYNTVSYEVLQVEERKFQP
ncbi:MAG: Omp28 family outer membrane lipoprotein [Flavobacteriales bacterium]|nr:Omp28 family outer membrane lipoprotein [Flavobacteriales bacterium]